ncbi:RDD family protein [Virgibacillus oceani]|nr:RDD family protein [Virgibacillus oceani]
MDRFKAFLFDYLLILVYLAILVVFGVFLFPSIQELFSGSLIKAQFVGFMMVTLPISLYFIVCDSIIIGQTFGKKKMGIQVFNENQEVLPVLQAVYRVILKFIPWELSHYLVYRMVALGDDKIPILYYMIGGLIYALIFAYILTAIFTKKKQTLYDIAARTQVVKVASK